MENKIILSPEGQKTYEALKRKANQEGNFPNIHKLSDLLFEVGIHHRFECSDIRSFVGKPKYKIVVYADNNSSLVFRMGMRRGIIYDQNSSFSTRKNYMSAQMFLDIINQKL